MTDSTLADEPQVPVQWGSRDMRRTIPEWLARLAYEEYARHHDQSFERLHERGGFGIGELLMLLADSLSYWKWRAGAEGEKK